MNTIVAIQVSADNGNTWKTIHVGADVSIPDSDYKPRHTFKPSNKLQWSATLDMDTDSGKLLKDFISSQQKKNSNLVRRLAARSIINASFHS